MKGYESLQKSYQKQKEVFDEAKARRISNRKEQIEKINQKIKDLEATRATLELQNQQEKEFETFDSFRAKSEEQSRLQKGTEN